MGQEETRPLMVFWPLGLWGLMASGPAASDSGRMTTQVPDPLDIEGTFGWVSTCLGSVSY